MQNRRRHCQQPFEWKPRPTVRPKASADAQGEFYLTESGLSRVGKALPTDRLQCEVLTTRCDTLCCWAPMEVKHWEINPCTG